MARHRHSRLVPLAPARPELARATHARRRAGVVVTLLWLVVTWAAASPAEAMFPVGTTRPAGAFSAVPSHADRAGPVHASAGEPGRAADRRTSGLRGSPGLPRGVSVPGAPSVAPAAPSAVATGPAPSAGVWPSAGAGPSAGVWPLQPAPEVVRGFDPPDVPWASGHRGVDLAGTVGQQVHAALGGRVTFAGRVAGRGVVVVDHGGHRTTYEPVTATVARGDEVTAGQVIGVLTFVGSHCVPRACLHWGLLEGDTYLDPLTLVGGGPRPVRLFPVEGFGGP